MKVTRAKLVFWLVFITALALLIALIETQVEVSLPFRIFQKIVTLYLNILPTALVGYLVLAKTKSFNKTKQRLLAITASVFTALLLAAFLLIINQFLLLLPAQLTDNLARYFTIVALIATILATAAVEFEIRQKAQKQPPVITLVFRGATTQLKVAEITHINSRGNYSIIHYNDEQVEIKQTLSSLLAELQKYGFLRVHKQFVVNPVYIRSLQSAGDGTYFCRLADSEESNLPVGRSFYKNLQQILQKQQA